MPVIKLTPLEARVLSMAAESIGDDLNEYGLSAAEKAAYRRAIEKLRDAR